VSPSLPAPLDDELDDDFVEPAVSDDGYDEAIDQTACWLATVLWAAIVAGGLTLGAGGAYLVLRRFER